VPSLRLRPTLPARRSGEAANRLPARVRHVGMGRALDEAAEDRAVEVAGVEAEAEAEAEAAVAETATDR